MGEPKQIGPELRAQSEQERRRFWRRYKGAGQTPPRRAGAAAVVSALVLGATVVGTAAPAAAADNDPQGCSYGAGGPYADALCWIDMADFGTISPEELLQGSVSKDMNLNVGRYTMSFTATVSAGEDGAQGVAATALPTWPGSAMGTKGYIGTKGSPAFYQATSSSSGETAQERDTISLTNIKVVDTDSGQQVKDGFSIVAADAESTGKDEGFRWKSDVELNQYTEFTPDGGEPACPLDGLGSNTVDCIGLSNVSGNQRGIQMVSADAPTEFSSTFMNNYASSREGVAFAVVFSTAEGSVSVTQGGGSDGKFNVVEKISDVEKGTAESSDGQASTGKEQFISGGESSTVRYTTSRVGGNTPPGRL